MNGAGNDIMKSFFADLDDFCGIMEQNLRKILSDNRDTDYGRDNGFGRISSEEEYAEKVPLTTFDDYLPYLESSRSITAYPILYKLLTSGTMGKQKTVFYTPEALDRYAGFLFEPAFYFMGGREGPNFHSSLFRPVSENGVILASSAYYRYNRDIGLFDPETYAGGSDLLFTDKTENITYVKAMTILCCEELVSMQSMFIYEILIIMSYIEENCGKLIADMRSGFFSEKLDPFIEKKLRSMLPSGERINELERIFSEGFDVPAVPKIWKKLKYVSGIGGKVFEVQEKALKKYTGDIPFYYFIYASSECVSGIPIEMNKAEYALIPRSAYYEFLSVRDNRIYKASEISAGEDYELILTNFSGLYRYATGDIVTIEYIKGETPVVSISGRRNHVINIAGEKLDEDTARSAINSLSDKLGVKFSDFAMGIDAGSAPEKYVLFAEAEDIPENAGELFDRLLSELSPDYLDLRGLESIGAPEIVKMKKGEIGRILTEEAGSSVHNKPHTFLNDRQTALLSAETEDIL